MPYTIDHTKEGLSRAYITAIAGMAGVLISEFDQDYGVDGSLAPVVGRPIPNSTNRRFTKSPYHIDYQLKATTSWRLKAETNEIIYDLEVKNYNDMANRDDDDESLLLFLLCLPNDQSDWLNVCAEQLIMKNCCYWYRVSGGETNNSTRKRITIPASNILTVEAVQSLLEDEKNRRVGRFQ